MKSLSLTIMALLLSHQLLFADKFSTVDIESFAEVQSNFAIKMYSKIIEKDVNCVFSPLSISYVLGMVFTGSGGNTKEQFKKILNWKYDANEYNNSFLQLTNGLRNYTSRFPIKLKIRNSIWAQKKYTFYDNYLSILDKYYHTRIFYVDYRKDFNTTRKMINDWVLKETEQKVQNFISEDILNSNTRLVLINTVYFRGEWQNHFNFSGTRPQTFHVNQDKDIIVPTMSNHGRFNYLKTDTVDIVELPYIGKRFSMFIILPVKIEGLEKFERNFHFSNLHKWISDFKYEDIAILMPKFTFQVRFLLNSALKELGLVDAFGVLADFSGIESTKSLYISTVLHEARIQVDEIGSEAQAATGAIVEFFARPLIKIDHPFMFLILDNSTGSIIFMGRVVNPLLN